jgi:c(7)-type cytochrome triheme protein
MSGPRVARSLGAAGSLVALLLTGCSAETRQKILPYFFDGFATTEQKQRPPTRRVRRDFLQEIEALKRELAAARAQAKARESQPAQEARLPAELARNWPEAAGALPKDGAGRVDWVAALRSGAIAPRPAMDPKGPAQALLDLDVELESAGSRLFRVGFSHAAHTEWLACASCHPAIFPLSRRAPPSRVSMKKIAGGEFCGACHGKVAFGVEGECARCHTKIPPRADWQSAGVGRTPLERARSWSEAATLLPATEGVTDWSRALAEGLIAPRAGAGPKAEDEEALDLDVVRAPGGDEQYRVVFRHATHTAWVSCESCHPEPFRQEAGQTPMSMDRINDGRLCGMCHGAVAFSTEACGRCHPSLVEGK